MAADWDVVPLGSLIEPGRTISYGIVQPGPAVNGGVPIVRVGDVRGRRIAVDTPHRVAPQVEAAHSRTRLRGGELLMTLVGTVGEMAVVPAELAGWNTARAVAVIPLRADVGAYWASLALSSPEVRAIIDSRVNTTVQTTLNLRDVAQLPVLMPPRPERERIAQILGTLDDKIELNRRISETLEEMARALFKSWFVDFDPVRAKAEGRDPGLPKRIAAVFPDRLVDSELGKIPEGWEVMSLDEMADFRNGLALQKYPYESGPSLPVIKIAQLRKGGVEGADLANSDVPPDYVVEDGDLLFSWSGSLECQIWTGGTGALNQHLFKVTSTTHSSEFMLMVIKHHLERFRGIAADKATTMGHIKRGHLSEAKIALPRTSDLSHLAKHVALLVSRAVDGRAESATLSSLLRALLQDLVVRDRDGE